LNRQKYYLLYADAGAKESSPAILTYKIYVRLMRELYKTYVKTKKDKKSVRICKNVNVLLYLC